MKSKDTISPPTWADRFLEWYCNPDLLEEIQGDTYELYERDVSHASKKVADLKFIWNVFRFFRWSNIRRSRRNYSYNSTAMIKNYLLIGFRNALRHRLNSFINIAGLALGIAGAITIFIFIDQQYHLDTFHTKKDQIYQITNMIKFEGKSENWGDTPIMLGPALQDDQSIVESTARVEYANGSFRYNDRVFTEFIWFVDQEFSTMFDFPVLKGNRLTLKNKNTIILEQEIAEKYFGITDPIGQQVSIKFDDKKEEFVVGAVIKRPNNSSIYPRVLISMEKFNDLKFKDTYDWSYLTDATFIQLKEGHQVSELKDLMKKYVELQNASSPEWLVESFKFYSLNELSLHSFEIVGSINGAAHPAGMFALGTIALLLLLLSCFNYMNVAVATAATRLKEIGIRKVIGSKRTEIVHQFLTENFLLTIFSFLVGIIISYTVFLPGLNTLFPITVPFAFSSGNIMFLFFASLLIIIGFASGAYPALYISSFKPISILRGREKFGQRSLFSRALLTIQFILAFTTIVGSFVFIDNSLYLKNKDWGYNNDLIITIPANTNEHYLALRDAVSNKSNVALQAGSNNQIGYQNNRTSIEHHEQRHQVVSYKIGFDYMETMNIRLKEGRFFNQDIQSDKVESVIVNEKFVKEMNWKDPLNESFVYDSVKRFVIGVVSDFHYNAFYEAIGPVMFTIAPDNELKYLVVRTEAGHAEEMEEFLKGEWRRIAPDDPYEGFLQHDVFADFYQDNNSNMKLLVFISGMAIILACLGLFGLVSFNITRRLKEFSIRKVFGANVPHIFNLMNRDYMWILLIAFFIGAPAGFFLMNYLIQHIYPDPQQAGPLPFIIAITLMILTVGLTVGSQLRRVIRESPTQTLRND